MEILITGTTGFIGAHLHQWIQKGIPEAKIFPLNRDSKLPGYHWDNLESNIIPGINAIIHLSGKAHDLKNTAGEKEYFDVNFGLTRRIYDFFLNSSAQKFIFISSIKAVADTPENILDEDAIPNPITPYGQSKLKAEEYILANLPADKEVYILRPCMVHGPGNKGNMNLLYHFVSKGWPYPLAAFKNERSFLSIDNFCFVIQSLLTSAIPSGIYHLADDRPVSTIDLINIIAEVRRTRVRLMPIPPFIIRSLALIGSWLHLPFNSHQLNKLTGNYIVSNAKIKKALGINSLPLSAKEGLLKTFYSFS